MSNGRIGPPWWLMGRGTGGSRTVSGAVAHWKDKVVAPLRSLVANIEPVQDLHGYDNPWPAGGGKNKFQVTAATQTISGVTFIVNEDGTVLANGTATDYIGLVLGNATFLTGAQSGTYILNGCPSGGSSSTYNIDVAGADGYDSGNGVTLRYQPTISNTATRIRINPGTTVSNLVFKPMIRLATETDATYAPYENICPISGWSAVNVWRTGVNAWDEEWEAGQYNVTTGEKTPNNAVIRSKNFIPVKPSTEYRYSQVNGGWLLFYDENKTYLQGQQKNVYGGTTANALFTTPSNAHYMTFYAATSYGTTYNNDISINYPSTDTTYHLYSGNQYTIQLGQTVYGGTLTVNGDGSGTLVVTHAKHSVTSFDGIFGAVTSGYCVYKVISGTTHTVPDGEIGKMVSNIFGYSPETRTIQPLFTYGGRSGADTTHTFILPSSITSLDEANTWLSSNPTECMFYLATPITIPLTPQEISTLKGANNVWADTGDVTVTYLSGEGNPALVALALAHRIEE